MFRKVILMGLIMLGLTACKMGPDYTRPDMPAKETVAQGSGLGRIHRQFALVGTLEG